MEVNDTALVAQLAKRNEAAFEQVFKTHFKNLHAYACSILKDDAAAEEAVQNVFFKLKKSHRNAVLWNFKRVSKGGF